MKFKARWTIVIASSIQLAMGFMTLFKAFTLGGGRPAPCMVPAIMTLAAIGGLMVQHPHANPVLRPMVIIANILILVMGICSFVFLFAEAVAYQLPGDVPPIAYLLIGAAILGPIFSNIIGIMLLPPPRGGSLY